MKVIRPVLVFVLTIQSVLSMALLTTTGPATAQENPQTIKAVSGSGAQASTANYKYVAQNGDSYTKMARKAVQTYGLNNKVKLSPAKIIFAETNLTVEAGSPYLDAGQSVTIKESSVKTWMDKAKALSASQEAAWNYYVQFVNFNTDAVGEAK